MADRVSPSFLDPSEPPLLIRQLRYRSNAWDGFEKHLLYNEAVSTDVIDVRLDCGAISYLLSLARATQSGSREHSPLSSHRLG